MAALNAEVLGEHGTSVAEQRESCRAHFARVADPRHVQGDTTAVVAATFEPLYAAVVFTTSLLSRARQNTVLPSWHAPGAIVEWYYASYNALRAILAATGTTAKDTHMAVAGAVNDQLRMRLPHPFDMVARWARNEEFTSSLPTHLSAQRSTGGPSALTETFNGTRTHARRARHSVAAQVRIEVHAGVVPDQSTGQVGDDAPQRDTAGVDLPEAPPAGPGAGFRDGEREQRAVPVDRARRAAGAGIEALPTEDDPHAQDRNCVALAGTVG